MSFGKLYRLLINWMTLLTLNCLSKIEQLWHGFKFLEKLKYLNLSFSKNLKRSPDFSGVQNLETLVLKGCASLTEVHPSLVHHKKVVLMNLEDCKSLKALPGKLEMSSLKELILSGCSEFKILPEFGESVEHLSMLSLEGTAIRKLPSSLGCLVGLTVLNLKHCKSLVFLPDTIHGFHSLKVLNISGCSKLCRLPEGLKEIKCLEELWAKETAIEELPSFIFYLDNLQVLSFAGCKGPVSKIPSSISKLSKLKFLRLNRCQKLVSLPELPSSIIELDASNCESLEISKFNPSKPCIVFASPIQLYLPQELKSFLEALCLSSASFDMLITGCEIPSWFVPQECVSWAKIQIPNNCPLDEWVGFALCFLLVSYADPPELCSHEIDCYLFGPNGKIFISTRTLPPMEPCYPHLYILLSINRFRNRIFEDNYWSEIEFALKCYCCYSLEIVRWGCRLVCKQDVEDWNKATSQCNKN